MGQLAGIGGGCQSAFNTQARHVSCPRGLEPVIWKFVVFYV